MTSGHAPSACRLRSASPCSCPATDVPAQARKISNAGAPVFSLDGGRVLGAISLSGGSDMMHIHTLGLVRQAAETVTSQLRERERIRELAIKNQYMRALVESDSRGIVTVDQTGRIVEANSTARKLLKLSPGCEGKSFEESVGESYNITGYLKEGKGFRAREILARRSGTTHFASLDPIRMNSGELVGGLFTVMEKKEMMRMAVEMTGAHAHFTFESILGASESLRSALHPPTSRLEARPRSAFRRRERAGAVRAGHP
ncbi:MAG: hypothetical protein ACLSAH_15250 [Bilophila wadsworthia]